MNRKNFFPLDFQAWKFYSADIFHQWKKKETVARLCNMYRNGMSCKVDSILCTPIPKSEVVSEDTTTDTFSIGSRNGQGKVSNLVW